MPQSGAAPSPAKADWKENDSPLNKGRGLPYRSVFAVLTTDSILVYDTHHTRPLAVVRGLHYAGLSDCQWSADGKKLIVSSIDGYISIVTFENGELGEVFNPVVVDSSLLSGASPAVPLRAQTPSSKQSVLLQPAFKYNQSTPRIPPCEPGQSATLEAPPSKRLKKTRITPTLITPLDTSKSPSLEQKENQTIATPVTSSIEGGITFHAKRSADEILEHETNNVGEAVTKLTLSNDEKPKKKKRIQPMLVSASS
jgi:chromatin assembly factor 1 subunit B